MRIDDLLPFVEHARLVNSRYERVLVESLVYPGGLALPSGITPEDAVEYFVTMRRVVPVVMMHDDLSVMVADLAGIEYRFLAALPPGTEVTVKVQEKDYQEILSSLRFDSESGVYYDLVGVSDYAELTKEHLEALNEASLGDYTSLLGIIRAVGDGSTNESLQEKLNPGSGEAVLRVSIDAVERLVYNYLSKRSDSSRVPVLIGNTAVTKSALVKSVAKELGMRLVDFRCAFLDKMDLEGFRSRETHVDTGEFISTTAPPMKLLECTDDYIKYARKTVEELKRKLPSIQDPEELRATQAVLEKMEVAALAPVLFFDEVTRATKAVQNAFVEIFSSKSYRGAKFSIARVIAATNLPIEMNTRTLDFQDVYITTAINDAGIVERYEPIVVRSSDVEDNWFTYIEGKGQFDSTVVDFLKKNRRYAYHLRQVWDVVSASKSGDPISPVVSDEQDVGVIPFPNYRTWEFVSNHMKAVKGRRTYFDPVLVEGFLGKGEVSEEFIKVALEAIPEDLKSPPGEDFLGESVEASFRSGTPVLLLGMTSIGKTSRIKKVAKNIGARVVTVNLAQMDRVDVQGAPSKIPVADLFMGPGKGRLPPDVRALIQRGVKEFMPFTSHTTKMIPDFSLQSAIEAAQSARQKVILFFDELNRADKNTMSAVLEAVSDHRFAGVEFPFLCTQYDHEWMGTQDKLSGGRCPLGHEVEPQVIVAAAANYGKGYEGVQKMDPAISGRFSVITKTEFDDTDKQSIVKFMKTSDDPVYPEILIKFIESKPLDSLKVMLSSVESRSIENAAPSLRAWSDLAKALGQLEDPALHGELPGEDWEIDLSREHRTLEDIEKRVWSIPANWVGLIEDHSITVGAHTYTVPEFVEEIKDALRTLKEGAEGTSWFGGPSKSPEEIAAAVKDMSGYLLALVGVNKDLRRYRHREFLSKFGRKYAEEFSSFYDENVGRSFLDIKDVKSPELAWKYGEQLVVSLPHPNDKRDALMGFMESFYTAFGDSAPASMYEAVLDVVSERLPNKDMFLEICFFYTKDGFPAIRGFLNKALGPKNTMKYAKKYFLTSLSQSDVEEYYKQGLAPTGTGGYPPTVSSVGGPPIGGSS